MKKVLKVSAWVLVIVIALLGTVFMIAWKSPKYYTLTNAAVKSDSITPFANYHLIADHPRPYIIEGKNYVIIGATHTRDPLHAEIKTIEAKWKTLNPTIALVEGRLGFLLPGVMDPVKELGEGGKVAALAKDKGIPLYNWDLSKETLAAQLQEKFSPEQIALYQILNPYFSQLRFGKPASPETAIEEYLPRAKYVRQEANFKTTADVDRVWKTHFPNGPDWRVTSDETTLPGYLNDIMATTNDLRNRQLVAVVKELTTRQERVFLISGSSHAACVAPAFQ